MYMADVITIEEMKSTATNLRRLASDPRVKKNFTPAQRKSFNDDANVIIAIAWKIDKERSSGELRDQVEDAFGPVSDQAWDSFPRDRDVT
jgi:hypothetical protein